MKNKLTFAGATFEDDRIASAQAALDTDLSERTLTVDTAVASLSTEDRRAPLPLFTRDGYPVYTRDGKRVYTAPVGDTPQIGAWSQTDKAQLYRGGSLYMSFFPRKLRQANAARYELSLTSALGLLEQMAHKGGIYDGSITAGDLIRDICGGVSVYVSEVFESVALYGFLPYVTPSGVAGSRKGSAKDNFLSVCFALNASVRANPDGTLRVENLPTAVQSIFDRSRIYRDNYAIEDEPPVTSVTVLEHQYIPDSASKTLFEGTTTVGQTIIFSEPCGSLSATGFSITESGANYAVVTAGSGTLTGVPYVHTTREITRTVTSAEAENVVRIEDATLVGITNSADVANRLAEYYAHRRYINADAVIEYEDAGAVVSIWDNISKVMRQACIEAISPLNFSRTLKGRVRALVGFTPWQTVPFTDEHVILATDQTYTFPDDIDTGTEVQVILIGGGQGGTAGESGTSASNAFGGDGWVSETYKVFSASATNGGQGGAGGNGGLGGNIYRTSITVDPGDSFTVTIGAGGSAGGGLGGNTTFGTLTSANGSPGGYYDPSTQTQYGKNGTDGVTGANGGKGGYINDNGGMYRGESGGDVTPYTGGTSTYGYTNYSPNSEWGQGKPLIRYFGPGGGGGAAKGNNGGNAQTPHYYGDGYGGDGGDGADGAEAANYGDGGSGGNGGGGGGGAGSIKVSAVKNGITHFWSYGGAGGAGGAGSPGKQGCIILIYRKPAQD